MNKSILIAGTSIAEALLLQPVISHHVRPYSEDQKQLELLCAKHKARYVMSQWELDKVDYGKNCNGTGWEGE